MKEICITTTTPHGMALSGCTASAKDCTLQLHDHQLSDQTCNFITEHETAI